MKKALTMAAVLLLVLALGIGGTLAYLTSKTDTVTNTFTVGNVSISLTEHKFDPNNTNAPLKNDDGNLVSVTKTDEKWGQEYKLIPGTEYYKDPTVTVKKDSEACYLFVKLEASNNITNYLTFTNNLNNKNEWSKLDNVANVYYRTVSSSDTADQSFALIKDNKVTVNTALGSDNNAMPDTAPTLAYTAYAIQQSGFNTASNAWTALQKQINPSTSGN